jgi:hypothetical protein
MEQEIRMNRYWTKLIGHEIGDYNPEEKNNLDKEEIIRKGKIYNTGEFLDLLSQKEYDKPEILPLNCRYNNVISPGLRVVIIEEYPKIRTAMFDMPMERMIERLNISGKLEEYGFEDYIEKNQRPYKLRLSFPFVVYLFKIDNNNLIREVSVFFRLSPITSLFDYLLVPNLFNVSDYFKICIGDSNKINNDNITSLSERVENYIDLFWSTPFNTDYIVNFEKYSSVLEVSDLFTWVHNTKIDPMFIFNTPWIKSSYNITSYINSNFVKNDDANKPNFYNYRDIFTKPNKITTKNKQLFNNTIESIYINNHLISVGDELTIKKDKQVYVKDLLVKDEYSNQKYIKFDFDNNKEGLYKITSKFSNYIDKQLVDKSNDIESIELNGEEAKIGDIIQLPNNLYRKLIKIRKAIDGNMEILLNRTYYLAKNCKAEVVNDENFKFNGILLDKQSEYYMGYIGSHFNAFDYFNIKFNKLNYLDNNLNMQFHTEDNQVTNINPSDSYNRNISFGKVSDLEQLPTMFRMGTSLLYHINGVYKTKDCIYTHDYYNRFKRSDDYKDYYEYYKHCLINKNQTLNIRSFDLDINFNINDKVVIPDWQNPINMLRIKTITGFSIISSILYINVVDSIENTESIPYLNIDNQNINIGSVRKISISHRNIKSGMKIKSIKAGIPNFPKKDTNIIIGFINDTGGEPLVLCSNCCTIWFTDLINQFEIIPKTSKKWKKLNHAEINVKKIKPQLGDILINLHDQKIMLNCRDDSSTIPRVTYPEYLLNNQNRYYESGNVPYYHKEYDYPFHGIINPRKKLTDQFNNLEPGLPNFHNMINQTSYSRLYFDIGD